MQKNKNKDKQNITTKIRNEQQFYNEKPDGFHIIQMYTKV